jgi:hypothetical protein
MAGLEPVERPRAVEHDEGLSSAPGTDLLIGDPCMTRQSAPVSRVAGQLSFVDCWAGAGQQTSLPLRSAGRVVPAVHCRARQRNPGEGDVMQAEPLVSQGHNRTVHPI